MTTLWICDCCGFEHPLDELCTWGTYDHHCPSCAHSCTHCADRGEDRSAQVALDIGRGK